MEDYHYIYKDDEIVDFEMSKLLKQLGFDQKVRHYYIDEVSEPLPRTGDLVWQHRFLNVNEPRYSGEDFACYSAPCVNQVVNWVQEKWNYEVSFNPKKILKYLKNKLNEKQHIHSVQD